MKLLKHSSPSMQQQQQHIVHIVQDHGDGQKQQQQHAAAGQQPQATRGQKLSDGAAAGSEGSSTQQQHAQAAASPTRPAPSPAPPDPPPPLPPSPSPPVGSPPPSPSPPLPPSPAPPFPPPPKPKAKSSPKPPQAAAKGFKPTGDKPTGDKPAKDAAKPAGGAGEQATSGRNSGSQRSFVMPPGGGTLFTWGLAEARLGRDGGDSSVPEAALPDLKVISIAASRHSAIATADGQVWTMGHNDSKGGGGHGSPPLEASGQLGRGGSRKPGQVVALQGQRVVQVVTGRYHTLAVTDAGALFTWGLNDWGQLGRAGVGASKEEDSEACFGGATCHDGTPRKVGQLEGVRIVGAASGRYNTMALDDVGQLYVWGYDGCASNGTLPEQGSAWKARRVKGEMEGKKVVAFDAGYVLWIAATEDGAAYTCNHQDDGYAGTLERKRVPNESEELGRAGDPLVPMRVLGELETKRVVAVAAGREHALAVTSEGAVYSWGGRADVAGRKGSDLSRPGLLQGAMAKDKVLFVAAGEVGWGVPGKQPGG